MNPHRPIQILVAPTGEVIALCDDGTIWEGDGENWMPWPPIQEQEAACPGE